MHAVPTSFNIVVAGDGGVVVVVGDGGGVVAAAAATDGDAKTEVVIVAFLFRSCVDSSYNTVYSPCNIKCAKATNPRSNIPYTTTIETHDEHEQGLFMEEDM